jgi:hypothetical protein
MFCTAVALSAPSRVFLELARELLERRRRILRCDAERDELARCALRLLRPCPTARDRRCSAPVELVLVAADRKLFCSFEIDSTVEPVICDRLFRSAAPLTVDFEKLDRGMRGLFEHIDEQVALDDRAGEALAGLLRRRRISLSVFASLRGLFGELGRY